MVRSARRDSFKQEPVAGLNNNEEDILHITEEAIVPIRAHSSGLSWDVDVFLDRVELQMVNQSEDKLELEFDIINIASSLANAIRRVLIAEVPSMAIEKVYLYQNTSVIPDEVLCHRLGLLPIYATPTHFVFPLSSSVQIEDGDANTAVELSEEPIADPKENLVFELNIKCKKKRIVDEPTSMAQDSAERLYENAIVRAKQFKWIPIGKQVKIYSEDPPRIVNDEIVVAKLRPGQELEFRCHCVKGIARDHAKFSPVATASYRLLPEIRLDAKFTGQTAEKLRDCFSKGVIEISTQTGEAYVKDARKDTCSRNVFQHAEFKDSIFLSKNPEHFIFTVESTGAMSAAELVVTATRVLRAKTRNLRALFSKQLDAILARASDNKNA